MADQDQDFEDYIDAIPNMDYDGTGPIGYVDYSRGPKDTIYRGAKFDEAAKQARADRLKAIQQRADQTYADRLGALAKARAQRALTMGAQEAYKYPNAGTDDAADAEAKALKNYVRPDDLLVYRQPKSSSAVALSRAQRQKFREDRMIDAVKAADIPGWNPDADRKVQLQFAKAALRQARKAYETRVDFKKSKPDPMDRAQSKILASRRQRNPALLSFSHKLAEQAKHQQQLKALDGGNYMNFHNKNVEPMRLAKLSKEQRMWLANNEAIKMFEAMGALNLRLVQDDNLLTAQTAMHHYNPDEYYIEVLDIDGDDETPGDCLVWEIQKDANGQPIIGEDGLPQLGRLIGGRGLRIIQPSPASSLNTYKRMQYLVEHPTPELQDLESYGVWNRREFRLSEAALKDTERFPHALNRLLKAYMRHGHFMDVGERMYFTVLTPDKTTKVIMEAVGPAFSTMFSRFRQLFVAWFIANTPLNEENKQTFEEEVLAEYKTVVQSVINTPYFDTSDLAPGKREFYKDQIFMDTPVFNKIFNSLTLSQYLIPKLADYLKIQPGGDTQMDLHLHVLLTIAALDLMNYDTDLLQTTTEAKPTDLLLWGIPEENIRDVIPKAEDEVRIPIRVKKVADMNVEFFGDELVGKAVLEPPTYSSAEHKARYQFAKPETIRANAVDIMKPYLNTPYRQKGGNTITYKPPKGATFLAQATPEGPQTGTSGPSNE